MTNHDSSNSEECKDLFRRSGPIIQEDFISSDGIFWISGSVGVELTLSKLDHLEELSLDPIAAAAVNINSFRMFSVDELYPSKDIFSKLVMIFQNFKRQKALWKELYVIIGSIKCNDALEQVWEASAGLFEEISIHGDYYKNVELRPSTAKCLAQSPSLTSIHLVYMTLGEQAMLEWSRGLATSKALWRLHLFWCTLQSKSVPKLAKGLSLNQSLEELFLVGTKLADASLATILKGLCGHHKLKRLNMEANHGRDACLSALCEVLSHPQCQIQSLDLTHQYCNHEDKLNLECLVQGGQSLGPQSSLEHLDLTGNVLTELEMEPLWKASNEQSLSLRHLNLAYNRIETLPEHISCPKLERLNLTGNPAVGCHNPQRLSTLLRMVADNPRLGFVADGFSRFRLEPELQESLDMNLAGRCLFSNNSNSPVALWPLALERCQTKLFQKRPHEVRINVLHELVKGMIFGHMGGMIDTR